MPQALILPAEIRAETLSQVYPNARFRDMIVGSAGRTFAVVLLPSTTVSSVLLYTSLPTLNTNAFLNGRYDIRNGRALLRGIGAHGCMLVILYRFKDRGRKAWESDG
jgi:hypothetical protein